MPEKSEAGAAFWFLFAAAGCFFCGYVAAKKDLFGPGRSGPVSVRCHIGDQTVYDGVARAGLEEKEGSWLMTDSGGRKITIDKRAVCVTATQAKTTAR